MVDRAALRDVRRRTGAGMSLCKQALEVSTGDIENAVRWIAEQGKAIADSKSGRTTAEGRIASYVHSLNPKLAGMVDLVCETDFVARTEAFKELAAGLAMHVVAYKPSYVTAEGVPAEEMSRLREDWRQKALDDGKPAAVAEKIAEGRLLKWRAEHCLLDQPFLKDPERSVLEIIEERVASLKENIRVAGFVLMESGGQTTVAAA